MGFEWDRAKEEANKGSTPTSCAISGVPEGYQSRFNSVLKSYVRAEKSA